MHEALSSREGLRALTGRDIAAVYRILVAAGVRQQQIAEMVGQSQSEVSEIMSGRQVMGYDLLVRCEGLDVPRGLMVWGSKTRCSVLTCDPRVLAGRG